MHADNFSERYVNKVMACELNTKLRSKTFVLLKSALKMTNEMNEMCVFRCTFTGSRILFSINFRVSGTQKKKAMQVHAVLFHLLLVFADFRLHTTWKRQVDCIFRGHEMT